MKTATLATKRFSWKEHFRIVPSRFPPIDLFERIADPSDWEALIEIESLTNDRLRQEAGDISLVPVQDRISGPGSSAVMAAFTHIGRASRFTDGTFGVYYASRERDTSVVETSFHMKNFYAATREPQTRVEMRVYGGKLNHELHDATPFAMTHEIYSPESYAASQRLAKALRGENSAGLVYNSVRHRPGLCLAGFLPKVVGKVRERGHLQYLWDGTNVSRYFDYAAKRWCEVPSA